jgi:uncharacterized protein (TIGR02145 family)
LEKQHKNDSTAVSKEESAEPSAISDFSNASACDTIIEVKAGAVLNVGITSATSGGSILTNRLSDINTVGLCWNCLPEPTVYHHKIICTLDSASFIGNITNLLEDSLVFFRAFAITSYDTVYSEDKVFYTHRQDAVADADGNYYNTVKIGTQIWLGEDLKTTRLNDGTPITLLKENDKWAFNETPAYCWYANDSVSFSFPRGKLYNWFAVKTGKLCPTGWHIPSDMEWITLKNFLGGDSIAGGKLKTRGTFFWRSPNIMATGESGFSAFPGGLRNAAGAFSYVTIFNCWWSTDEYSSANANSWYVYHGSGYLYKQVALKPFGYSVRCLKD